VKLSRSIFLSALILAITHFAWAQGPESVAFGPSDPVKTVKLFPNPAVDYVSLKFEQPVAKLVTLEVHSIIGNLLEVETEVIDDFEVRIKVKELPTGYYLLDVKNAVNHRGTYKFLKR